MHLIDHWMAILLNLVKFPYLFSSVLHIQLSTYIIFFSWTTLINCPSNKMTHNLHTRIWQLNITFLKECTRCDVHQGKATRTSLIRGRFFPFIIPSVEMTSILAVIRSSCYLNALTDCLAGCMEAGLMASLLVPQAPGWSFRPLCLPKLQKSLRYWITQTVICTPWLFVWINGIWTSLFDYLNTTPNVNLSVCWSNSHSRLRK